MYIYLRSLLNSKPSTYVTPRVVRIMAHNAAMLRAASDINSNEPWSVILFGQMMSQTLWFGFDFFAFDLDVRLRRRRRCRTTIAAVKAATIPSVSLRLREKNNPMREEGVVEPTFHGSEVIVGTESLTLRH